MKRKSNVNLIIGLAVLVVGAALLIYGYITYNDVRASLGGALAHAFSGGSKAETQAVIEMIAGGALAIIGLGVMFLLGRRRR